MSGVKALLLGSSHGSHPVQKRGRLGAGPTNRGRWEAGGQRSGLLSQVSKLAGGRGLQGHGG